MANALKAGSFDLYVTQDVDRARRYVRERYSEQLDKRYGQIRYSSLRVYGICRCLAIVPRVRCETLQRVSER